MTGSQIEELINKEIDGVSTPEESAALHQALASDDEARRYYEDLQRLSGALDAVPAVDPPDDLKLEIMRAVRTRAARRQQEGWLEGFLRGLTFRPRPAHVLSFAAGLAIGMFVFALWIGGITPPDVDRSRATGTLVPLPDPTQLPMIDRTEIEGGGFQGSATTRSGNGRVVAEFRLSAREELMVVVEFDSGQLRPLGVEPAGPEPLEVVLDVNRIQITHAGEGRYRLHWAASPDGGQEIRIRLLSGEEVWEGALQTARETPSR
jgi:hypothetical protein